MDMSYMINAIIMLYSSCSCILHKTRARCSQARDSPQESSSVLRNDMKSFLQHGQDM